MATNVLAKEMSPSLGMYAQVRALPLGNLTERFLDAAAEVSTSCKEESTWIFTGLGSEHSEKLVQATMACNETVLDELDKREEFHNMKLPDSVVEPAVFRKNYLLSLEFQALLDASVSALKDDASGQKTQKVLLSVLTQTLRLAAMRAETTDAETQAAILEVMERSAQFVETNVAVPQFNTPGVDGVRALVFNVYTRLAKVLGRNTPEAVKADAKAMIVLAAERIDYSPGSGRASKVSPQEHIANVVVPLMDEDGKDFAFDIGIYHTPEKPSLMKFYRTLHKRFSRERIAS